MVHRGKEKRERHRLMIQTELDAILGKILNLPEIQFPYGKSNDYLSMFIFNCGIGFIFS